MVKVVVFDIGKVVWDYEPFLNDFLKRIAQISHKKFIEVKKSHDAIYQDLETDILTFDSWVINHLHCSPVKAAQELDHSFNLFYQNNLNMATLSVIKKLRINTIKVAYLSNVQNFMGECFKRIGLPDMFDFGIFSFEAKARKPAKEIYQQIFNYGAWLPEEVVFIDDKSINVQAANSLGLIGLDFTDSQKLIKDLRKLKLKI